MRYTELQHPLTQHIDDSSPEERVSLLALADAEIYGSLLWGLGLLDPEFIQTMKAVQERVQKVLKDPHGCVILAGAGTSGRIAYHSAGVHDHRKEVKGKVFGLIAGGPDAFFKAKERIEDLPEAGLSDLLETLEGIEKFVYIGITCGLSAAYVASQAHHCMSLPFGSTVVIGFNPVEEANPRVLNGLDCTFKDVLMLMREDENSFILNPIIGPEPVTGSTRMKGGTATKVILELLLNEVPIEETLTYFKNLQTLYHQEKDALVKCLHSCSSSLDRGHGIVYLAGAKEGFLTYLDASECPPTFSAEEGQVASYVDSEFAIEFPELNCEGKTLSDVHPNQDDAHVLVFFQQPGTQLLQVMSVLEKSRVSSLMIGVSEICSGTFQKQGHSIQRASFELALKWKLNTLTTCSFIAIGKVLGNKMIDLKISNLKLWERAVGIISEVGSISFGTAEDMLTKTIMGPDWRGSDISIEELIQRASKRTGVVAKTARLARDLS